MTIIQVYSLQLLQICAGKVSSKIPKMTVVEPGTD